MNPHLSRIKRTWKRGMVVTFLLFASKTFVFSQNNSLESLKIDAEEIYNQLKVYESATLRTSYYNTINAIDEAIINKKDSLIILANNNYTQLKNLSEFYYEIEAKKDSWESRYFQLWEKAYFMKSKVQNLYQREEPSKNTYGGTYNETVVRTYKREIFESGMTIVNNYIQDLKDLPECDYFKRIQVTTELLDFLNKMEELFFYKETKDLRRSLKRSQSLDEKRNLILEYQTL